MRRKKTRQIHVGNVPVGGKAPIAVQSMTNTDTRDVAATVRQIEQLQAAGCEIVRLAVPDEKAAAAFKEIKKQVRAPLIADIHFDHAWLSPLSRPARTGSESIRETSAAAKRLKKSSGKRKREPSLSE